MTSHKVRVRQWLRRNKKRLIVGVPSVILGVFLLIQLAYPSDRLLPWQQVDSLSVGGLTKHDTTQRLDTLYREQKLSVYFGDAKKPQLIPKLVEFGLNVDSAHRIESMQYSWYLRLVPTSFLWGHMLVTAQEPTFERDEKKLGAYLQKHLGESCQVAPINATAKVVGNTISVVNEENGGTCKEADVKKSLATVQPNLTKPSNVRIDMEPIAAKLTKKDVQPIVSTLNTRLSKPVSLTYDGKVEAVDSATIRQWLTFSTEGDVFDVRFDTGKSDPYLQEKLSKAIERPAGVSKVATHDFVEVSRQDGQVGRKLDTAKTLDNLKSFLLGKAQNVPVGEAIVQPQIQYTRSYSNTDAGLSALMKNYAESHPGTYGVSLIELDGKRRRAAFNENQKFTTASTYKLYVAYSTLKRIESGEYKWSDQTSGGRDLARCFDDMIVKSDNACAEALVARIGYGPITKDAQTIVSPNTTFLDKESYKTTASDLSTFMASLATGQIPLNSDSRSRFLDALKRNVYRQGIPAGAAGQVADKVGFLDGLLHDAAIVYSPSGTYVLSIMTDKSAWANIAELTREIEKLRNQ